MQIPPPRIPGRLLSAVERGHESEQMRRNQWVRRGGEEASWSMLNHILYATQTYMSGQERRKQPGEMRVKKKNAAASWKKVRWMCGASLHLSAKLLQVSGDTHRHSVDGGSENTAVRRLDQLNPFSFDFYHYSALLLFHLHHVMVFEKIFFLRLHTIHRFQCWDRADNSNKESLSQHLKHFHWQCERLESTQLRPLRS